VSIETEIGNAVRSRRGLWRESLNGHDHIETLKAQISRAHEAANPGRWATTQGTTSAKSSDLGSFIDGCELVPGSTEWDEYVFKAL